MFSLSQRRRTQPTHCSPEAHQERPQATPPADIWSQDAGYILRIALPGVRQEDIRVTYERGVLSIEADDSVAYPETASILRREFGGQRWQRSFQIGEDCNDQEISAQFSDGILTLHIAKKAEAAPRSIAIQNAV